MTALPPLVPFYRHLAPAAAFQRDARKASYPVRIRQGRISREEAETDYQAWVAIAHWTAGERIPFEISLTELELAASVGLQNGERAVARRPGCAETAARRDQVSEILTAVQRQRALIDDLNARLRRRAEQQREAA